MQRSLQLWMLSEGVRFVFADRRETVYEVVSSADALGNVLAREVGFLAVSVVDGDCDVVPVK